MAGCPKFASNFIGYVEDCCPPEFQRAEIKELAEHEEDELVRVDLQVLLHLEEMDEPRVDLIRDTVWLARFDGNWRVVRLSAVAEAASLLNLRGGRALEEVDHATPPDVALEQREFARELADYRSDIAEREDAFTPVGKPARCGTAVTVQDPAGDTTGNPGDEPPGTAGSVADLRAVSVGVADGRVCVIWKLARDADGPLTLNYNHRDSASGQGYIRTFDVDLRPDGRARVTSGDDDEDRPQVVPGEVGRDGAVVTLVITRGSFEASARPSHFDRLDAPPLERFAFGARVQAALDRSIPVWDWLGSDGAPQWFGFPSGRQCRLLTSEPC